MLVSVDWLRSLLPGLDAPVEVISARLTGLGLEVEGENRLADALRGVVVAEVVRVEPHPKADKLRLATVSDGAREQTVVCGAPNVEEGQRVALATLGTTLPNGMTMEPRKIRGVASEGMLCAEDELGLSEDHEGILVLSPTAPLGRPLSEAIGYEDVVLELGITPNRPDALSHLGVARDLAALEGLASPEIEISLREEGGPATDLASVHIDDPERCSKYAARVITGVTIGPSPRWVQDRLRALGQRPISNVVDATNLVLLEQGHPLHAFDLDALGGHEIRVRRAAEGEKIRLLDGTEKQLVGEDLVIADAEVPVALAGIMGGFESEVTGETEGRSATTRVLLESAWFDPTSVRKTAKRHGMHTEASHRFERGADPGRVEIALDRCAAFIAEWAGGTVHPGQVVAEGEMRARDPIPFRAERASMLLGRKVTLAEAKDGLTRLGLKTLKLKRKQPAGATWFEAPSWRPDLGIEADLIEEVGRLGGYDGLEGALPAAAGAPWTHPPERDPEAEARDVLVGMGFLETISLAFTSAARAEGFEEASRWVRIANPLGEESRVMRPSLVPALLQSARHNQDQLPSIADLRMFELGRTFAWGDDDTLPVEVNRLALVLRGRRSVRSWASDDTLVDVYDLKGVLEGLQDVFRVRDVYHRRAERTWLHPRSSTAVASGEQELGYYGELHPDVADRFGLEGAPVFVVEIDLDRWAAARGPEPRHRALPKLPPAQRDLSFFVDTEIEAAAVEASIRSAAPPELEGLRIFDVYEGKGVPAGKKSLAVELTFRAADRTLADGDVESSQAAIVEALRRDLRAELRDG
ncbi:MAG: phenylalanine--tRNA ligase subunit beta [Myxococcota bacterium]